MVQKRIVIVVMLLGLLVGLQFAFVGGPQQAAAAEKTYTLRIGHSNAPIKDSIFHVEVLKFKELVEKYSKGRIVATIYPSAQLGSDAESVEYVKTGTQDIIITSLNLITNHCPRLEVLILPYMLPDKDKANKAIDQLMPYFNEYITKKANMRILDLPISDYRKLLTREPIMTMSEVRKIKFRLPPSPIMLKTWEAFGVKPTIIPWVELFSAMQLGTVDGFECDPSVLVSARFNEVVRYVTDVDWMTQVSVMVMSEMNYQKLPDELKKAVDKSALETRQYMLSITADVIKRVIDQSTKVKFLGRPDDYEDWIKKGKSVWPQFYKRIGDGDAELGKQVVDKVSSVYNGM